MKQKIVAILLMLFCKTLLAQTKPALFIGTYDIDMGKGFMCSDRGMIRQEVLDYKEYIALSTSFWKKYKKNFPSTTFVAANRAVIIYEFQKRRGGWNCTVNSIAVQEAKNIENAKQLLNKKVALFPTDYATQPNIIFEFQGKGTNDINPKKEPTIAGNSGTGNGNIPNPGSSESNANSINNTNNSCPTYGFKLSNNNPSYNCVALEWWSLSTKTNTINASGNFQQSTDPQAKSFTIEFRKQGAPYWKSEKRANTGLNRHIISGLDACTKYEVRLITTCDNNQTAAPTNSIRFETACAKPGNLSVENITSNSAKINSQRLTALFTSPCGSSASTQIRIIEFKTSSGLWQEVICNSGSPCLLNALSAATIYRVRARHKYGNNLYSNYTNEISFTTSKE